MNTKRLFSTLVVTAIAVTMLAIPARRGVWKTITLADGTEVRATLVGDEYGHYWKGEDGKAYQQTDAFYYQEVDAQQISAQAKERRHQLNVQRGKRMAAARRVGEVGNYQGTKKAVMILVNYQDVKFNEAHDNALFQKIANQENFTEGKFKGSMRDYFRAQSRGQFEMDFDVVGPVTVSNNASYYGQNDYRGNDKRPGTLIKEAVTKAKDLLTAAQWKQYDWNNDGEVDQVYIVYAGKGEADGGEAWTIWPHAWTLDGNGAGKVSVATGLRVNSYACGSELDGYTGDINGIGTMCHEYSHCLGYPDFYDTDYSGGQGMGKWDLMDSGPYNGDGYQPAGYTSYELWMAGWLEPTELKANDLHVTDMKSLQNGGESYVIYNDKNKNEYYLLENRQLEGWDGSLPSAGLLILHVDYDASAWASNGPNDEPDHQRMTVVPADGIYDKKYDESYGYYIEVSDMARDPFPYTDGNKTVNAFNKDFKTSDDVALKAAQFFKKTSNGTNWMKSSVEKITQNDDHTISFDFVADPAATGIMDVHAVAVPKGDIYTLDGRYMGTDYTVLPRGLYVIDGKKVVK